jgi:class 3 adenylate cyclase
MSWKETTARDRIRKFRDSLPEVKVERFEDEYLPRRMRERSFREALGAKSDDTPPLYNLPAGSAVVVEDAVHIYVRALGFDDVRQENGEETEYGHARSFAYLSLLYGAADRAVEAVGAQRVDFHGARMHAVIAEPAGAANLAERVSRAVALVKDFTDLAREAAGMFASHQQFPLRFRIGMDLGTCVALNSARSDDHEPVFIGSAANHAAKLAAGEDEGVYMSDRVRAALRLPMVGKDYEDVLRISDMDVLRVARSYSLYDFSGTAMRLESWDRERRLDPARILEPGSFKFHEHQPPLSTIDYSKLTPSYSIRMPLVSIFADLDAYTAYIDHCMATGCLPQAVRLLHVIRSEFNAVLKGDFGGRKVRFIGDCIHGLIAAGRNGVDPGATVEVAARCVGGIRQSFNLCQELVEHADRLGLAIGFEYGQAPISRIGLRGPRAVRVASSMTTKASEKLQQDCGGAQTRIGPRAYEHAPAGIRRLFGPGQVAANLIFDDVDASTTPAVAAAAAVAAPAILTSAVAAATPVRAFLR